MEEVCVKKRDGRFEPINEEKINQVLEWACEGLDGVYPSEIAMKAKIQFTDGVSTQDIHKTLTKTAADMIEPYQPNYQYVAARLALFDLRKRVYGGYEPDELLYHIEELVHLGRYDKEILEKYTKEEINELGEYIDHDRDFKFAYSGMKQMEAKYLVQDRVTGQVFETPQMLYMLVGMCLYQETNKEERLDKVRKFYDATSLFKLSLPTPILGGVRTPTRQFSSCTLIESGDDLDEINATSDAIVKYASKRAGIGINGGAIRAVGSSIRGGEAVHTGCLGFYKYFKAALKSCSQGALRGASATLFYPMWHYEVENLLVLKNNKGTEENRLREMDYGVQLNGYLWKRLLEDKKITLFSPDVADGELYQTFFSDQERFAELYEELEDNHAVRKKRIKAKDLFKIFATERAETGRIYTMFVDNVNENGVFNPNVAPVRQSNLCVAPETKILTKRGYEIIGELEGETVEVWNGEEFSETTVKKTASNAKLLKVITDSGQTLECTPEHKFYTFTGYGKPYKEVRTKGLKVGDKLMKFDLPVVYGDKELDKAYENGFYSGDGCFTKQGQRIYLYHEKRELKEHFEGAEWLDQDNLLRSYCHYKDLKDKFFVPTSEYSVESRLKWLAGWLDADGCVYRNGTNEAITGSSVELGFLKEVQLMLQTLGINSKVKLNSETGLKLLPANDGTGKSKEFLCKDLFRLLIPSYESYKLLDLGLKLNRLKINKRLPQRDANRFIKIVDVVDEGRIDDTYCFTEPKRNLGMFNGLLTGQCVEIVLPTEPMKDIHKGDGEVALCTLAAFNLGEITCLEDLEELSEVAVEALDNLLDYQDYPLLAAHKSSMGRRTLGIGVTNFAYYLAKNGCKYSDGSGNKLTHELAEAMQYYLLKASVKLAKEKGCCDWFEQTKYAQGILPIDYKENVCDKVYTTDLLLDWETLREDIEHYGLRNSTLTAIMPAESSSLVSNSTNGIEPVRDLVVTKGSKDGVFKQLVPEVVDLYTEYETCWEMKDNKGYLTLVSIFQKFFDQAISANTYEDPAKYTEGKLPLTKVLNEMYYAYQLGVKTLYYHNTRDGAGEEDSGCESGACSI